MKTLFYLTLLFLFLTIKIISQVSPPEFSIKSGFYQSNISLLLSPQNPVDIIYYSTDGSEPTIQSEKYTSPISLTKTTVVRARCFVLDSVYSTIKTNTYFINENIILPVFSISTNPANLWDSKTGIYVLGDNWRQPNYSQDWEIPVHIEFFETDKSKVLELDAGAKILGEGTRAFSQKSLAIFARSIYGYGKIKYKFFSDLSIDKFENIILRSGGSDWKRAMFRDPLVHEFAKDIDVDRAAYRPSIVFLNGDYWGIHNIREKIDEHYLESHFGVNPDSVDIDLYWGIQADVGTTDAFHSLQRLFNSDMTIKENYDTVDAVMDLDNFTDYMLTEIFMDNTDWPANNVKAWKARKAGSKWRWTLYDMDASLDLYLRDSYKHPSLDYATSSMGVDFGNPPQSILFLNKLLTNQNFKNKFINRFADLTNTVFSKGNLLEVLKRFKEAIEPEIPRHFQRWDDSSATWYTNIESIKTFVSERYPYICQNFIDKFNLQGISEITIKNSNNSSGGVKLNSIKINNFPWAGKYFNNIPITLTAIPLPGYKFKSWQGAVNSDSISITLNINSNVSLSAFFEKDSSFSDIVINEINYNSTPSFDVEDWIELYNNGNKDVDLSGWQFKDSDDSHTYIFPVNTTLQSNDYLVLCRDTIKFSQFFPDVKNKIGNFDFGINNAGEQVRLFDSGNNIIDSLTFDDILPWPTEADGTGKTLELKNPALDNSNAFNWSVSFGNGTPGKINDSFIVVGVEEYSSPENFQLYQNFPNPFNPITTIRYSIPDKLNVNSSIAFSTKVTLKIYDVLGREISMLVNDEKTPGNYVVKFNGINLASGIYFYRLQAGSFVVTKKLILIK